MLKKLFPLTVLFAIVCISSAFSQKYFIKEGTDISEHGARSIFVTPSSEYMDVDYEVNKQGELVKATVTKYNNQLKQIVSSPLPELLGKIYLTSYTSKNKNYLLAIDQSKAVYQYEVDGAGKEPHIASTQLLFNKTGKFGRYDKGYSPDSSFVVITCNSYEDKKDDSQTMTGVILNKENKVVTKFSFAVAVKQDKTLGIKALLTNSGKLAVLYNSENNEKGVYKPVLLTLIPVGSDGKAKPVVNLSIPEGRFTNPVWTINGDKLFYSGLLAKKEKKGYTAAATGSYDLGQSAQGSVEEETILNASYLQGGSKSMQEISKEGVDKLASFKTAVMLSDGSTVELLEEKNDESHQSYYGSTVLQSSYSMKYNLLGNVYVVKWSPAAKLEWIKVIKKNQDESDLELWTSVACIRDSKDGVHVLFQDRPENTEVDPDGKVSQANVHAITKHSLAAVYISKDGKMKKQFILDNESREFQFSPAKAYSYTDNEMFFLSIKHKMIGHDSYGIGKITVK